MFYMLQNKITGKCTYIKFSDEISLLPVWDSIGNAAAYMLDKTWGKDVGIVPFSIDELQRAKEWHQTNGMQVFLHLMP